MPSPVIHLVPTVQKYDWGKIGASSKVAQFAQLSKVPEFEIDERAPYAELWMGTHPKSPSRLRASGIPLSEHLAANASLMGQDVVAKFDSSDGSIPFLLKILSIEKALSIQTHPDKAMAARLHAEQPDIYKDANHKPELAIALTSFSALCGFRPLPQIAAFLTSTPEFASLIPDTIAQEFQRVAPSSAPDGAQERAALKNLFAALMTAPEAQFQGELLKLVSRYRQGAVKPEENEVKELVLTLESQFPGDIGVFCAFVLNYMKLNPGEAIFLGAGEPHAYVSGDIVECMATSDNVIRAGLTPKLRDVPNLISGLTYLASEPSKHKVFKTAHQSAGPAFMLYDPPIPEFSVLSINIAAGGEQSAGPLRGPSILIVTEGEGGITWNEGGQTAKQHVGTGDVVFMAAGTQFTFGAVSSLIMYRAFVEC